MTTSFGTHDGQHFVCAEADGRIIADRVDAAEWETFAIEPVGPGRIALRSAHGHYLSALDLQTCAARGVAPWSVQATAETADIWEHWRVVPSAYGGVGLYSYWGRFLVAEQGGGGVVLADRAYDEPGPWESFTAPGLAPMPRPAPDLTPLTVERNRRYLANAAGRFDWREITAFSLLSRLLRGETEYVRQWLLARRAEGFTVTRVILTLDGDYWRAFRCAPDMLGYWQALDLLAQLHAEAGLYLRVCFLGALEPFGGVWDQMARRDIFHGSVRDRAVAFAVEAAQRLASQPHVIGELANEPTMIGMRDAWENGALVSLGWQVKAVAPWMLLCGGEDNEGRGLVRPFDVSDAHMDRSQRVAGWEWVKRSGEHPAADQDVMPFVAGEPINFGEARVDGGRDVEAQPAVAFGAAAVGRARRWAGQCFHWDGGLWTTEPRPETQACIRAWHAGMDAIPMLTDGVWRGHWGLPRGDYWRDVWPDTDNVDGVERHIREGRGPWRAFGVGPYSVVFPEPKGWDYTRHLDASAVRVAHNADGTFAAGVYRR